MALQTSILTALAVVVSIAFAVYFPQAILVPPPRGPPRRADSLVVRAIPATVAERIAGVDAERRLMRTPAHFIPGE
jgi:hypothetical protein